MPVGFGSWRFDSSHPHFPSLEAVLKLDSRDESSFETASSHFKTHSCCDRLGVPLQSNEKTLIWSIK